MICTIFQQAVSGSPRKISRSLGKHRDRPLPRISSSDSLFPVSIKNHTAHTE